MQESAECKKSCNFTAEETGQDVNLCRAGTSHPENEGRLIKLLKLQAFLFVTASII